MEEKEIKETTPLTFQSSQLIAQLPLDDAALLAFSLAGGEVTPELQGLIARLQESLNWKPLVDFFLVRNIHLLDALERHIMNHIPWTPEDEIHDSPMKSIADGLAINQQSREFALFVTSIMLFFKLIQLRHSKQINELQELHFRVAKEQDDDEGDNPGLR